MTNSITTTTAPINFKYSAPPPQSHALYNGVVFVVWAFGVLILFKAVSVAVKTIYWKN